MKTDLKVLNEKFGEAEKAKDMEFLNRHLSEDLLFRRASGTIINKQEFLSDLADPNVIYQEISTEVKSITISKKNKMAVVKATVFVKITKDGGYLEGYFTNLRFFKEENGDWVLTNWYNEEVR